MIEQLDLLAGAPVGVRKMPAEPIVRTAEVDGPYRWTLRRAWGAGPTILWCGLNPSTADGTKDDPTMLREIRFSYRWGFGSLVKVNVFPYRTSSQVELRKWLASGNVDILLANALRVADEIRKVDVCVAAWGNGVDPIWLYEFEEGIAAAGIFDVSWKCLGTTASGAPIHTLARGRSRVPDDAILKEWKR